MTPAGPDRHDRDAITSTALALLDNVGLPDLSMRRLATELGVQASALYWHFANKQELLAAVADRILARLSPAPAKNDVAGAARAVRDALLAYRDGAEVVMTSYALGFGATAVTEALSTALPDDVTNRTETATALAHFVLGHTFLMQQRMHAEGYGAAHHDTEEPGWSAAFERGIQLFTNNLARSTSA